MCGMVGSAAGWQEVPYLDADTPLAELARRLVPVREAPACFIVPGLRWRGAGDRVDVMRGEETQLLGALRLHGAPDGDYVLPGTHSKWVRLRAGRVATLRTYMSGELFASLRERGTLAAAMRSAPEGADAAADAHAEVFARGVAEAGEGALSHALFGVRARVVTGALASEAASAFVSGLLIGAEWHDAVRASTDDAPVRIVGEPALARLHAHCAAQLGLRTEVLDVRAVQLAAWQALQEGFEA
jgi:2-dehydro-3-deoxygalactonokinase